MFVNSFYRLYAEKRLDMSNDATRPPNVTLAFVDALEQHVEKTSVFYDENFVDLLLRYYPFRNIALTVYGKDFEFIDGLARNDALRAGNHYIDSGLGRRGDYVSHYIATSYNRLETSEEVVLSSQIPPPNEKSEQDFLNFLKVGNLKYCAVVPVDRSFRIMAYKSEAEGDFTESEIALLKEVLIITRSKFQGFLKLKACRNLSKIKNDLLDRMQVGYITLNENFFVLDCNSKAIEFLSAMLGKSSVMNVVGAICEEFPDIDLKDAQVEHNGYILTSSAYSELDYFGRLHRYYYFTMMEANQSQQAVSEPKLTSELQFSLLSAREMEVLDAFAHGLEYKEISEQLFISEGTVRTHLKSIYRKLDISNQRKLIYEYVKYCK